jgi:hypothetical protein
LLDWVEDVLLAPAPFGVFPAPLLPVVPPVLLPDEPWVALPAPDWSCVLWEPELPIELLPEVVLLGELCCAELPWVSAVLVEPPVVD